MSKKPVKKSDQNKAWFKKKTYEQPYNIDANEKNQALLIVCEGSNTEVEYLRSIPAPHADIKFIGGCGSKTALVDKALRLSQREMYKGRKVWCVYDLDYKGDQVGQKEDFNSSITKAESKGMKVAYCNDSFELWFVLHYKSIEQALLRFQYYDMLSELWDMNYEKQGKKLDFCIALYDFLLKDNRASQTLAIERSKALLEEHKHKSYAEQNPCTTVFQLIELLIGTANN
jgi:RloB-like protein